MSLHFGCGQHSLAYMFSCADQMGDTLRRSGNRSFPRPVDAPISRRDSRASFLETGDAGFLSVLFPTHSRRMIRASGCAALGPQWEMRSYFGPIPSGRGSTIAS